MRVQIRYKTANTKKGEVISVNKLMTIAEARKFFNDKLKGIAVSAYIARWDGWNYHFHSDLKKENA